MSAVENAKKTLEEIKKQILGLSYYLKNVNALPKDRKSQTNLEYAKNTVRSLQSQLDDQVYRLEKDLRTERAIKIDAAYDNKLGIINSPTESMKKNSQALMRSRREIFLGGGLMRTASDGFMKDLKKIMVEKALGRRNESKNIKKES